MDKRAILQLYKNLLRGSNKFTYTDKEYYRLRIRKEFQINKTVSADKANKLFQVSELMRILVRK
jgi:hypothetical protein